METLSINSKYLVLVNMDEVGPSSVAEKLEEAGIKAIVLGIPTLPGTIQFLELIGFKVVERPKK